MSEAEQEFMAYCNASWDWLEERGIEWDWSPYDRAIEIIGDAWENGEPIGLANARLLQAFNIHLFAA